MPTLVLDDGPSVAESGAILWYFGEGTRFVPSDRYDRAKVLQWMFFEQYSHEPAIAVVRFLVAYSGEAERYASVIERKTADGYRALDALERHLGRGAGLRGRDADQPGRHRALRVYPRRGEGGFDLAGYPAIRAWLDRVAAEPGHVPIDA